LSYTNDCTGQGYQTCCYPANNSSLHPHRQHLNTLRSFIYFPATCFGRSIRQSSCRKHKYVRGKAYHGRGLAFI